MIFFLNCIIGENSIKACLSEINELLPVNLRCDRITGHSGRRTMITSSFNAGIDPAIISLTSKHRNLEQLKRYATPDPNTMMKSALAIGKAASATCNDYTSSGASQCEGETNQKNFKRLKFDVENNVSHNQSTGKIFYINF